MERAKISITKAKSGKYIVNLVFVNGKTQTVPDFNPKNGESLNGKEVEVERQKNQILTIMLGSNEIFRAQSKPSSASTQSTTTASSMLMVDHASNITTPAKAPYNFIPLNKKVVGAENPPDFDRYYIDEDNKRHTGYIELKIETKTPLYIRDTLTQSEMIQGKKAKDIPDFFSPANKTRIPGSSLRGMVRTMVEIMSFGKFGVFNDRRLYYRTVADTSALGKQYRNIMIDENDNFFPKIKAGILKKVGRTYIIYPSKTLPATNGTQIYRINESACGAIISRGSFIPKQVFFNPVSPSVNGHRGGRLQLKYALLSSVSLTKDATHPNKGYLIAAGHINGKHMYWVINEENTSSTQLSISDDLVKFYNEDKSRKSINLLDKLNERDRTENLVYPNGFACFYITDSSGIVSSFGHTGMFRLAYKNTIGDHISDYLKDDKIFDIPEVIFGNKKIFSGRIFFEDTFLKNPTNNDCEKEKVVTLLEPKPTTFQHYLVQTKENMENHPRNLAHYDSNPLTAIRGHKLYWHKKNPKYKNSGFNQNTDSKIKPVKADKTFTGRIRFENLSRVELGALLSALDLPQDCCHKIGMGKSLGLGSVKITPTLHLSHRKNRYTNLLSEWNQHIPESSAEKEKIADFKADFEKYVLEKLGENGKNFWQLDRMKELGKMLRFNPKPADNKTEYMLLGEFRERKVLPKPTEV
jgi:CRISPR-associated protein (TIGR03986 family)